MLREHGPACRGGTPLTHARRFAHVRGFRGSGLHLTVPGDTSLLETLLAAGVDVQYSCESGTCGTCEMTVLEGEVDHRDTLLTTEERHANNTIYPCVSRSKGDRLVLDA